MPLYLWEDQNTKYQVEILRDYDKYQEPPTEEELPEEERGKDRDWKKLISPGIRTIANQNWAPSKGYHVVFIGLFPWWEVLWNSISSLV